MSEFEAAARAVEETAKLGTAGLETSQKLGGFFAKVLGEPLGEVAGIATDALKTYRYKRLLKMQDDVRQIHEARGVESTRAVPPKLALPIFEEASLEDDPTLQSMWSSLLANAMDDNFKDEIRTTYTDIIKNLTGLDSKILQIMYNTLRKEDGLDFRRALRIGFPSHNLRESLKLTESDYLVSVHNLMRLQVVSSQILRVEHTENKEDKGPITFTISDGETMTIDKGTDQICMTPLGIRFIEACSESVA